MSATGCEIHRIGRERLRDRRENLIVSAVWEDHRGERHDIKIELGFYPDGRIGEVFARTARPNSTLDTMLDEGCQLISRLLQYGCPLAEIVRGMTFEGPRAETPLGIVVRALIELEGGR